MRTIVDEESVTLIVTREDLLEDGVLIDISRQAREAGLFTPVAITARIADLARQAVQERAPDLLEAKDLDTVFYDIAWMLVQQVFVVARLRGQAVKWYERKRFPVWIGGVKHELDAVCSPEGDRGATVLTVLLPGED